jgi:ERCC4-related helicase
LKLIISNTNEIDVKDDEVCLSPLLGHNIFNIDEYVADSEFEEIEVKNLNQIPLSMLGNVLDNYLKKIRKNGIIKINGVDLYLLALKITTRSYNLGEINSAIFGGPEVNTLNMCLVGINDVVSHLEGHGVKILSKGFNDIVFTVEGQRI